MPRFLRAAVLFGIVLLLGRPAVTVAQPLASGRAIGPITAKVQVDVYSDFQCPHCKLLDEQAISRVREDYALKGTIRLVHHDFPLPMHAYARQAAILALAAEKIGKFDVVSTALFKEQDAWAASGKVEQVVASVLSPADAKRVHDLAADPALAAAVQRDVDQGNRLNITSTPTILITKDLKTQRVTGSVSYAILKRYLDDLLAH